MTNMTVNELKDELKALGIEFPAEAKKAELVELVAAGHGDPEGFPWKVTAEDMAANKFPDEIKEGDVLILPKTDDTNGGAGDEKKPDDAPKAPEYKDGKYTVVTPVKFNGKVYAKGETVQLDGDTAKGLGKAVEAK